jgi:hypothetical protein
MADVAGVSTFSTTGVQGITPEPEDSGEQELASDEQTVVQLETGDATGDTETATAAVQVGDTELNTGDDQTGSEQVSVATPSTQTTQTQTSEPVDQVEISAEGTVAAQAADSLTSTSDDSTGGAVAANQNTGNTSGTTQSNASQALGQIVDVFA